jgi:uncharacterized protein (TIGR00661 family)
MTFKKRILVAPLNWGLGHATRCIPIINALIEQRFEPVIASDGAALELLKKEFPNVICIELPSYNITYSKHGFLFKWHLLKKFSKLLRTFKKENHVVQNIIETYDISGIISDNRFGVYSTNKKIPSVYITHQLRVLSGLSTWISSKMHQKIIKKHHECWIPDFESTPNLSGKLGHLKEYIINLNYLGPLSRFKRKPVTHSVYDIMVLLSGPEPQRDLLEQKVLHELKTYKGSIIVVQGVIENTQKVTQLNKNMTIYNFMTSAELEATIQNSHILISRSGYTSVMDFSTLEKKVFFIPTPGQTEQLYLAKRFDKMKIAPYCKQSDFSLDNLKKIESYSGFGHFKKETNFKELFDLFERE